MCVNNGVEAIAWHVGSEIQTLSGGLRGYQEKAGESEVTTWWRQGGQRETCVDREQGPTGKADCCGVTEGDSVADVPAHLMLWHSVSTPREGERGLALC